MGSPKELETILNTYSNMKTTVKKMIKEFHYHVLVEDFDTTDINTISEFFEKELIQKISRNDWEYKYHILKLSEIKDTSLKSPPSQTPSTVNPQQNTATNATSPRVIKENSPPKKNQIASNLSPSLPRKDNYLQVLQLLCHNEITAT